jgi:LemA protein
LFAGFLVLGILVFFFFQVGWRVLCRGLWKTLAVLLAILVVAVGAYRIGFFVDHLLARHVVGYKAGTIFQLLSPGVLLLGFAVFSGLSLFLRGFRVLREYKILADTPLIPIRSVALGLVSVRGKAQSDHPITSPVSNTPCCLYQVNIAHWEAEDNSEGENRREHWQHCLTVMHGQRFSLADDTGRVVIDPSHVKEEECDVPQNSSYVMNSEDLSRIPEFSRSNWDSGSYRLQEFLVLPGTEYQVTGTYAENPDSKDATDRYLICKGSSEPTMVISSKIGHKNQTGLFATAVGMIIVGTILTVLFGSFLVQALLETSKAGVSMELSVMGWVIALVVTGTFLYAVITYNELVRLRNENDRAWANIDVLLKQRHDEVPNLVEMVKGYMLYEKETLVAVTQARAAAVSATTVGEKARADQLLTGALRGLFATVENYPQLKANENFLKLQARISELEERIADRREFYNEDVTTFNTRIWQFPEFYMAFLMRLKQREMFKVSDADSQPAEVKFADIPMSSVERSAQLTKVMEDERLELEVERQRGSVTPEEYTEAKTALDEIMKRRMARSENGQGS